MRPLDRWTIRFYSPTLADGAATRAYHRTLINKRHAMRSLVSSLGWKKILFGSALLAESSAFLATYYLYEKAKDQGELIVSSIFLTNSSCFEFRISLLFVSRTSYVPAIVLLTAGI